MCIRDRFKYSDLALSSATLTRGQHLNASFVLKNDGEYAGEEVVQLYLKKVGSEGVLPLFSLKGVMRVALKPGEEKTLEFIIGESMLASIDEKGSSKLINGQYRLFVGGSLPSKRSAELGSAPFLQAGFELK